MQPLASELKQWRAFQQWTQAQAADHFGVPLKTYQEWERGRQRPQQLGPIRRLMQGIKRPSDAT